MEASKGWLFSLILLLSFLFALAGWLGWRTTQAMAGGILLAVIVALIVGINWLAPIWNSDSYASETVSIVQPSENTRAERVTLVIKVQGLPDRLIHGLSRDELRLIGECVTWNDAYVFSVQHFKDYFKNTETDGYSLYNKSVRWMKDVGALVPNAKGGVDVTDPIGREVFYAMCNEQWQIIEDLPYPAL